MLAHVHISRGNTKLGVNIPSVNLPPQSTCRPDAPCAKKCYARKGRFSFPHNKDLACTNLQMWQEEPMIYEREIMVAAFTAKFFRWHSSGDIPDAEYLKMMVRVAERLPSTKFLCFTKKFELVNEFVQEHGYPPENLTIVYLAWGEWRPENPWGFPMAYVRLKKEEAQIPSGASQCSGYCGDCVCSGRSCWDMKRGFDAEGGTACVVFNEH